MIHNRQLTKKVYFITMRYLGLTFRLLTILTALMVCQVKGAQACDHAEHSAYNAAAHATVRASPKEASSQNNSAATITVVSEHQGKSCDGCCCHGGACCSTTGVLSHSTVVFLPEGTEFFTAMRQEVGPQGPPYPLLRPPRISI